MESPPSLIAPIDAFEMLDLRVGRITAAYPHPKARKPSYILTIDLGELGQKVSCAQLTEHYSPDDLIDRHVIAAVNLGTRRIGGIGSEVLILGVPDELNRVVLLSPERSVPLGGRVF